MTKKTCPICGVKNDDDWPVDVGGEILEGGCQECWEKQCDVSWWDMVKCIQGSLNESYNCRR